MPLKKKLISISLLVICVLGVSASFSSRGNESEKDYLNKVRKNTILFGEVYKHIAHKYVENIDPEKLMRVGINAMLDAVDPYTVLIERDDNVQLQIITQGKYGGVGMLVGTRQDGFPTVVEPPYEGTPAMKAGIREGDKIIEIEGVNVKGMSSSEVAPKLRGEKGTTVNIKISREGEPEPLEFRLVRAEIVVNDIEYAGLVDERVGYIKLTRFTRNAGREIRNAIRDLNQQGMQGLILDLRNNPGGLLEAAVAVSDALVSKGELIVSTKGKVEETMQEYFSEQSAVLGALPLVVMINGFSASASEIVSGAVQDLDRGVLVGRSSFGKGLVQSVVGLTRDANLKLTTAKYYLPSGRLIQREKYSQDILLEFTDSSLPRVDSTFAFSTAAGRGVEGGGGVHPDVMVEADTLTDYQAALIRQSMMFNYASLYANTHENLSKDFQITQEMLNDFKKFLKDRDFEFNSEVREQLEALREAAKSNALGEKLDDSLNALEAQIAASERDYFQENIEFIKHELAMEISAKLWGTKSKIEVSFSQDNDLKEALDILKNTERYEAILKRK